LQPAAPIVSIAIAAITMTRLKFDFIANSPAWFAAAAICAPWTEASDGSSDRAVVRRYFNAYSADGVRPSIRHTGKRHFHVRYLTTRGALTTPQ
jgi:hypothetical protein